MQSTYQKRDFNNPVLWKYKTTNKQKQLTMPTIKNNHMEQSTMLSIPSRLKSQEHKNQRLIQLEGKEGAVHECVFET